MRTRTRLLGAAALAVALVLALALPGGAQTEASGTRRTITAVGIGEVQGVPDVLELVLGVSTRDHSAKTALERNSQLARKVAEVLRDAGVADEDVQTAGVSIGPVYDDNADVVAYEVSNTVSAKLRDLSKAGDVIDAATTVAGNDVVLHTIGFSFDDDSDLVAAARRRAVERARNQAEQLADAAGVDLGEILTIQESGTPSGPPIALREAVADSSAPISPGSEIVSLEVTVVFRIS